MDEQNAYVDVIRRKYQIEFINRYRSANQQSPDEWTVGIPQIGLIISLYTYAKYIGEKFYVDQADELLERLLENEIEIIPSPVLEKSANKTSVKFQLTDWDHINEIKELYKANYEIELMY